MPYVDEVHMEFVTKSFSETCAILLGRKTYDIFAAYWPHQTGPLANTLNGFTKFVVSNNLDETAWQNTTVIKDDITSEIANLKQTTDGKSQ